MPTQPTVVLVHGAFADASGFAGAIRRLQAEGVPVRAPTPLRRSRMYARWCFFPLSLWQRARAVQA